MHREIPRQKPRNSVSSLRRARAASPAAPAPASAAFPPPSREDQLLCAYSAQSVLVRLPDASNPLLQTQIDEDVRTRMVDWMLEVLFKLSGERFDPHTYFRAVLLADLYYKRAGEPLSSENVHLIGLACMYTASKYEDEVALRLEQFRVEAGGGAFSAAQLREQEFKVLAALMFCVSFSTVIDVLDFYAAGPAALMPATARARLQSVCVLVLMICARTVQFNNADIRLVAVAALLLAFRHLGAKEELPEAFVQRSLAELLGTLSAEQEKLGQITRMVRRHVHRFLANPDSSSHISVLFELAAYSSL